MSNPFQGLTPFGQDFTSQYNFFESIKAILNGLENKAPIVIESTTVPTQSAMELAYLAATVGNTLPVPTSQSFIWMNQGVAQGEFRTLDDIMVNINDVDLSQTTSLNILGIAGRALMAANSDILVSGQSSLDDTTIPPTSIVKYDRRTGQMAAIGITVNLPFYQFCFNPAGTVLAFSKLDGGGKQQIYTTPYPALTPITQLTTSTNGAQSPSWKGTKISYLDNVGGNWTIKIMDDNGTNQTTVVATGIAVANVMFQELNNARTKILYTKRFAATSLADIWTVNVNGTSNAMYIDHTVSADNPQPPSTSGIVYLTRQTQPNWSYDDNWIWYGAARKNVNTNIAEVRFMNPKLVDQGSKDDLQETYYNSYAVVNNTNGWFGKNVINNANPTGVLYSFYPEEAQTLQPGFLAPILNNTAFLSVMQSPSTFQTRAPLNPICIIANTADGYKSTGKIHRTSQFVPPRNDMELIRVDLGDGATSTWSLSKSELADFDHIMVVHEGGSLAASSTLDCIFNEDAGANYQNTNIFANTTLVRAYQTYGANSVKFFSSGTNGNAKAFNVFTIMDIKSTDNYKQVLASVAYTTTAATYTIANFLTGQLLGIWKNAAAIDSIRLTSASPMALLGTISYYGIRGTPRREIDL